MHFPIPNKCGVVSGDKQGVRHPRCGGGDSSGLHFLVPYPVTISRTRDVQRVPPTPHSPNSN